MQRKNKESILLTRSKYSNMILQEELEGCNFEFIECGLITHQLIPFDNSLIKNYTDLIITSNFASDTIDFYNNIKRVWVVGHESKKNLEQRRYNVIHCYQSAFILKKHLLDQKNIQAVYLSGNNITIDMPANIKRIVFYNTYYKKHLSQYEINRIKQGLNYILLYSANCAKTLLQLFSKNDLIKHLERTIIVAISTKVGKVVEGYSNKIINCESSKGILEFLKNNAND